MDVKVSCRTGDFTVPRVRQRPGKPLEELENTCVDHPQLACLKYAIGSEIQFILHFPTVILSPVPPVSPYLGPFDEWIAGADITYTDIGASRLTGNETREH